MTIFTITGLSSSSNATVNWSDIPSQRVTILDSTNPNFLRLMVLTPDGVKVVRGTIMVGIPATQMLSVAVAANNALTWPPVITLQPVNHTVVGPAASGFTITATAEISITYQWQKSTDSGVSWTNVTNTGVYTGATTNTLVISASTGLTGVYYRCVATNTQGSTNSATAVLTVS